MAQLLENRLQRYAWGSLTLIQELCGLPLDGQPLAEVWLGTHPRALTRLAGSSRSLLDLLAAEGHTPEGLPFLLKLIAVAHPLSLQAHPNAQAALRGYQREQSAGLELDARERSYPDPHHKPELLVALSPFEALVGFASVPEIVDALQANTSPDLQQIGEQLAVSSSIEQAFHAVMRIDEERLPGVHAALHAACVEQAANVGQLADKYRTIAKLMHAFPSDRGVVAALFMRELQLQPGQGLYIAPGTLHAYLHGLGVEIMANSDNVVRCGLTGKHVNVPELMRIVDFRGQPSVVDPQPHSQAACAALGSYEVPVSEFALSRVRLEEGRPFVAKPRSAELLLVTSGSVTVQDADGTLSLRAGASVVVLPERSYTLKGTGTCFRACSGE